MSRCFVVVGGGIAGVTVAEELRERDPDARVVLFDGESRPLYSRMLLKEYLKGAVDEDVLGIHDQGWFERRGIEHRDGTRVTGTADGRVVADDGTTLAYDALFATAGGAQADPFGLLGRADNVFGLWTLEEARRMRALTDRSEVRRAVVVGAGFLGLELADALATRDLETHFVMRGYWSRHGLGRAGAEIVHRALEAHGVTVQDGQRVEGFELEDGRVRAVRTDRGELPCDLVGLAVGLAPSVDYLEGTDAEVRDGVVVDEHMRSADPAVFAAGDAAEYRDVLLDRHRRTGTWLSAIDQARVAAAAATGGAARFEQVESHSVAVGGLDAPVVFLGDWDGGEEALERRYGEARYRRIAFREGRPVGASLIGESGDVAGQLRQLIRDGPVLDSAARGSLLEPFIDHGRRP